MCTVMGSNGRTRTDPGNDLDTVHLLHELFDDDREAFVEWAAERDDVFLEVV